MNQHDYLVGVFVCSQGTSIVVGEKPRIRLGYRVGSSSRSALSLTLRKQFLVDFLAENHVRPLGADLRRDPTVLQEPCLNSTLGLA